jgi:hypothetical protein
MSAYRKQANKRAAFNKDENYRYNHLLQSDQAPYARPSDMSCLCPVLLPVLLIALFNNLLGLARAPRGPAGRTTDKIVTSVAVGHALLVV